MSEEELKLVDCARTLRGAKTDEEAAAILNSYFIEIFNGGVTQGLLEKHMRGIQQKLADTILSMMDDKAN